MSIKIKYRKLVDKYELFTRFQIWRFRKKYPVKYLNSNYNIDSPVIHYIHRHITNNSGDLACGYYQYFLSEFKNYKFVIHDVNYINFGLIEKNDVLIVGGGGLLNNLSEWNYNINKAASLSNKAIVWSAGFNSYSNKNVRNIINISSFKLFAVRDYNYENFRCVPCASCYLPELNRHYPIKRQIGVIGHKDNQINVPLEINEYEIITNSSPLSDMIEFIGSTEVILTNSYHAAYWSALLQRKCILFITKSEKHKFYRYPPVFYSGNLEDDISKAKIYVNALKESKALTIDFLNDIKSLIAS
jgi:hypothetical protein